MRTRQTFFVCLWLSWGLAGSGLLNAYFQRSYPDQRSAIDPLLCYGSVLGGPANFVSALLVIGIQGGGFKYGWSLAWDAR